MQFLQACNYGTAGIIVEAKPRDRDGVTKMAFGYPQHAEAIMWKIFMNATGQHFRFLEAEFGFTRKSEKAPFVIYESNKVQILLYYDSEGRHELDFCISYIDDDLRQIPAICVTEMMLLADRQTAEKYQSPFPFTESDLDAEVKYLAGLVKKYGTPLLKGDKPTFEQIYRQRR